MTRDELEAVIWRQWPAGSGRGGPDVHRVDAILAAADAYAHAQAVDGNAAAQRREALGRAVAPARVHYPASPGFSYPACGRTLAGGAAPMLTSEAASVTCRACQRTSPYRDALKITQRRNRT